MSHLKVDSISKERAITATDFALKVFAANQIIISQHKHR
jgi:hypothetical protein